MVGSTDKLDVLLTREESFLAKASTKKPMVRARNTQKAILGIVRETGKQNDLDTTIKVEKRFIVNELANHANSLEMVSSLKAGIGELEAAEYYIALVRSPERYQQYAKGMTLPKNLIGNLPRDEARMFFSSHPARLGNWNKARVSVEEKRIIEARAKNIRAAGREYKRLQELALGLGPGKAKERELSR